MDSQLLLAVVSCDKYPAVHLCEMWLSPPLIVEYFGEYWMFKPSVLLNIATYSLLSSTGDLENSPDVGTPRPMKFKDTNLIFKACSGVDLNYATGPSCHCNHNSLRHQYPFVMLCIHKLKENFFLAMPELSSKDTENNHKYFPSFFKCS